MNKKISFTRPKKPLPAAADEWVKDPSAKRAAEKPERTPAANARASANEPPRKRRSMRKSPKTRPEGEPPPAKEKPPAAPPLRPAYGGAAGELKWIARMLASIDRQLEVIAGRLGRQMPQGPSSPDADPAAEAGRNDVVEGLDRLAERIRTLKDAFGKR